MSPTPIRIGLIGAGGIAGAHVAGYLRNPDKVVFAAVADAVIDNAVRRAVDTGAAIFTDYQKMLDEADIDAVDICLPHHLHKDAIVAAAKAGKHVLCEKPLCLTADEAEEVATAVDASGNWWLNFGSFWSGIQQIALNPSTGLRSGTSMRLVAGRNCGAIEASYMFKHGSYYYLWVSFDLCCKGAASTYRIMVGRSTSPNGPFVDRSGKAMKKTTEMICTVSSRWACRSSSRRVVQRKSDMA